MRGDLQGPVEPEEGAQVENRAVFAHVCREAVVIEIAVL